MTQENVEQNRLILKLRDENKLSWQEILDELIKQGLSGLSGPDSVKMKYYAVKKREKAGPSPRQPLTSPSTSPVTWTSTKRMTFWLPGDMIRKIKSRAKSEKRTASDIAREILGEYLRKF